MLTICQKNIVKTIQEIAHFLNVISSNITNLFKTTKPVFDFECEIFQKKVETNLKKIKKKNYPQKETKEYHQNKKCLKSRK